VKLQVVSAGHYLHTLREGEPLPDLTSTLKQVCSERPRRVDRFIELALLGSGLCARGRQLKPGCGIYLGSGFGPMGSNAAVQEQLLRDQECPKPFDFMNILGASAGFHVVKNLKLAGQNLFISRRGASLEAALAVVQADMQLGIVSQALLGVVEEATLPLDQHRQRQGLLPDTPVAEGSHWLLLEKYADGGKSLCSMKFKDRTGLDVYLHAHQAPSVRMQSAEDWGMSGDGIHDNPQAALLTGFLAADEKGTLLLVGRGAGEGYTLLHLGP